jgi:predicted dehydrogenase
MSLQMTRRTFLQQSALTAVGAPALVRANSTRSANEKLGIGVIGVGGRGKANLLGVRGERIVALCDVDESQAVEPRKWLPKAKFCTDFRHLFDRKDIDAVVISTPDHTHAPAAMMALKAGKHVYCEKPLTHSVYEIRKLMEQATRTRCVTQMGIQNHACATYRRVVELIQAGAIGDVAEVHVWHRGGYAPGDRPKDTPPVPEQLHYDEWLGPAPYRPYHPTYLPGKWRGWWDFGGGLLGDFGCHLMDLAHSALGLRHVSRVRAEGPDVHPESTPAWLTVRYEYPARADKPPVKLTWCNGRAPQGVAPKEVFSDWKMGILFIGKKGRMAADYTRHVRLPPGESSGSEPLRTFPADPVAHYRKWIEACKTGRTTTCGFDYAGPLTETVLLGNVAYRAGRPIEWDTENLKITNEPEAMKFIRREYRKGWTL